MLIRRASSALAAVLALPLGCCTLAVCHSSSSSLDSGVDENHVHRSLWFRLAYRYSATITSIPLQSLHFPPPGSKGALLFATREFSGDNSNPSGVILHVDELGHYKGQVRSGADYVARIERTWPSRGYAGVQSIPTPSGITFYRVDYRAYPGEYDSVVCGTTGDYALVFNFNAGSQAHLDSLVRSISTIDADGAGH